MSTENARFFATAGAFRWWLARHADRRKELIVGYYKKGSGEPSMSWPESVDEALCFGWIDGVRKRIDEQRYQIRFTPRRAGSVWSAVNIARVAALQADGRMLEAGLRAFAERRVDKSRIYAYEQQSAANLRATEEREFRADSQAWDFFSRQAPSYRQKMLWWVISAKRAGTRTRRLAMLVAASHNGTKV